MTKTEKERAADTVVSYDLTVLSGGLNFLLRALNACGLGPVPVVYQRKFALPRTLFTPNPCLFATAGALNDRWAGPPDYPAAVAVTRRPDNGKVVAAWNTWEGEPSGLEQAVGKDGRLLRRVYTELAANFLITTAVSAVGGVMESYHHRLEPDGSARIEYFLKLPGDDPAMADGMRMPQKVLITVDPKGGTKIEVVGGQGDSCLAATRKLIDMIGTEETQDLKPEFYQNPVEAQIEATS